MEVRDVVGYVGYSVDSDGGVYGPKGYRLKPQFNKHHSYPQLMLYDGRRYQSGPYQGRPKGTIVLIHTIVCTAFHGPRPGPGYEVMHTPNPDRNDYRACNLKWGLQLENIREAVELGSIGALTTQQVRELKLLLSPRKLTYKALGQAFGVSEHTISRIDRGKTYQWLG